MSFERYLMSGAALPQIIGVSHSVLEPESASFEHTHIHTEILVVMSGSGYVKLNDKRCDLQPYDCIVINPLTPHSEEAKGFDSPIDYFVISLTNVSFAKNTPQNSDAADNLLFLHPSDEQRRLVRQHVSELKNCFGGKQNDLSVTAAVYGFIVYLLRAFDLQTVNDIPHTKFSAVEYTKKFLQTHYSLSVNLDEIAARCFISKQYLIKRFTNEIGVPHIEFCMRERIKNAKYLLKYTDLNITQIGINVGFSSSSYFTKVFKQRTGLTPTEYKNAPPGD